MPRKILKLLFLDKTKTMYLFFDVETNGMPRNWKAPVTQISNWPRMVQIGWILYDAEGNELRRNDHIIKPDGWTISASTTAVHGISTARAKSEGVDIDLALNEFRAQITEAEYLVAHNISFDTNVVGAEFLRQNNDNPIPEKEQICTMHSSTNFCKIPGKYGYKWPKLEELHRKLFGKGFENAHNAAADIEATAACFWELRKRGVL